jgi:fluoride exporter
VSPGLWAVVGAVGACGAMLRYVVDLLVTRRLTGRLPWGTFVVNLSGSLVLGLLTGLTLSHAVSPQVRIVIGTGFCGAYTTFSTFVYEMVLLARTGDRSSALYLSPLLYVGASVLLGGALAAVGLAVGLAA